MHVCLGLYEGQLVTEAIMTNLGSCRFCATPNLHLISPFQANGTHLGTCIDRFYFGSCCDLGGRDPPVTQPVAPEVPSTTPETKFPAFPCQGSWCPNPSGDPGAVNDPGTGSGGSIPNFPSIPTGFPFPTSSSTSSPTEGGDSSDPATSSTTSKPSVADEGSTTSSPAPGQVPTIPGIPGQNPGGIQQPEIPGVENPSPEGQRPPDIPDFPQNPDDIQQPPNIPQIPQIPGIPSAPGRSQIKEA